MGLQRETASRGSMAIYTQIVFASILERIFFNAVPSVLSIIGTCLIISSAIYTALSKKQEAKPTDESSTRLLRVSERGNLEPSELVQHHASYTDDNKVAHEGSPRKMSQDHREDDQDLVLPLFNGGRSDTDPGPGY
ncbi:hypothetical protein MD484_g7141, partial [Candolleomyces efflorescens]